MHTPSAPTPPDPTKTASAQTATNVDTAIANAGLSHTNQITPEGSLTYNQTGSQTMTDQSGKTYQLPTYTATQAYSPANQALYNTNQQTQQGLANIANQQTQKVGGILGTNVDLSSGNIDKYTNDHYLGGFNTQWNNQEQSLDQKLADQGIKLGSQAYQTAQQGFTTQKTAANDQFLGDMYNNAQQAILTQRNQPLNEISALMSGAQVSQPQFTNTPTTSLPTVDQAGLINQNYQDQMGQYNTKLQQSNAAMGGLFGLGSSLLGGWAMSDRNLKNDIELVGALPSGLPVYEYNYVWGGERQTGVMADEAEQLFPDAVAIGAAGFKMVHYGRIS